MLAYIVLSFQHLKNKDKSLQPENVNEIKLNQMINIVSQLNPEYYLFLERYWLKYIDYIVKINITVGPLETLLRHVFKQMFLTVLRSFFFK